MIVFCSFITAMTMRTRVPDDDHRRQFILTYIDAGLPQLMKLYWEKITERYDALKSSYAPSLTSADLWDAFSREQPSLYSALENFRMCIVVFWNGSDIKHDDVLSRIYDSVTELIIRILSSDYVFPLKDDNSSTPYRVVTGCLGILHNFCHNSDRHIRKFRDAGLLATLRKFTVLNTEQMLRISMKAALISSYLLIDDEKKNFILDTKTITFLVSQMEKALRENVTETGYHPEELMSGLNNIAAVDANKKQLVEANVIPLYVNAMKSNEKEMELRGVEGILALSFDENIRQQIVAEPDCMSGKRLFTSV